MSTGPKKAPQIAGDDHEDLGHQHLTDLAWEQHQRECPGQCGSCHCNHTGPKGCDCYDVAEGVDPVHPYDPQGDGEHEFCGP